MPVARGIRPPGAARLGLAARRTAPTGAPPPRTSCWSSPNWSPTPACTPRAPTSCGSLPRQSAPAGGLRPGHGPARPPHARTGPAAPAATGCSSCSGCASTGASCARRVGCRQDRLGGTRRTACSPCQRVVSLLRTSRRCSVSCRCGSAPGGTLPWPVSVPRPGESVLLPDEPQGSSITPRQYRRAARTTITS